MMSGACKDREVVTAFIMVKILPLNGIHIFRVSRCLTLYFKRKGVRHRRLSNIKVLITSLPVMICLLTLESGEQHGL